MNEYDKEVVLDAKSILVAAKASEALALCNKRRKCGIDIKLFTVNPDDNKRDKQSIVTFLNSKYNPSENSKAERNDVDDLIGNALDKVLISDRVRSQSDFKLNNRNINTYNKLYVNENRRVN